MSYFRSEPMSLCHLIVHQECAFDCIVELGLQGKTHFVNANFTNYTPNNSCSNEFERCEKLLQIMQRFQTEINRIGLQTVYYENADNMKPKESDLPKIERVIKSLDKKLQNVLAHCNALQKKYFTLYENIQVLEKMEHFLIDTNNSLKDLTSSQSADEVELGDAINQKIDSLIMLIGSIPITRFETFELMIWRISRGNAIIRHAMFELPVGLATPHFQQPSFKFAFLIVFLGEHLLTKILKICQGFEIKLLTCASTSNERQHDLKIMKIELQYLNQILEKSCEHRKHVLSNVCNGLFLWRAKLRKVHQVYRLLNSLDVVSKEKRAFFKYLRTDCWIQRADVKLVRAALRRIYMIPTPTTLILTPLLIQRSKHLQGFRQPTYFYTNKFTRGFQNLIDAYGIATYRELNPCPYTIVTLPFLFAVMFGDVGHGILIVIFAIVLICREEKIERNKNEKLKHENEIFNLIFDGRYVILLMGLFSIYTGIIYNELLSKSFNLFGSSWRVNFTTIEILKNKLLVLEPTNRATYRGTPYICGVDPVWNIMTENGVILLNSLKMKTSIILGVLHMIFGVLLCGWNAWFFRNKTDFFLVFLPQLTFMVCLFLYLVVLIFHKWSKYGANKLGDDAFSETCAPSIMTTFMNMIFMKRTEEPPKGCGPEMFAGQFKIEPYLLLCAVVSLPILLLGKPLHLIYQNECIKYYTKHPEKYESERSNSLSSIQSSSLFYSISETMERKSAETVVSNEPKEINFVEIWMHQVIHTIECVLGLVTHTTSYLRLWALSLGHSQLSHVLWKLVLSKGLSSEHGHLNPIVIFFTFAVFATLTVVVLIFLEGLSAFLHTLRLHWIEFQSKFYNGLGESFVPFRFPTSMKKDSYE